MNLLSFDLRRDWDLDRLCNWLSWIACRKAFRSIPLSFTLWVTVVRYPSSRFSDIKSINWCILSSTMGSVPPRLIWSETACVNVTVVSMNFIVFEMAMQVNPVLLLFLTCNLFLICSNIFALLPSCSLVPIKIVLLFSDVTAQVNPNTG